MTLQSKYDSLHSKFEQLQLNHTSLEKFAFQLQQCLSESVGIVVVCGCVLSSNKNPEQQVNNDNTMIIPVCIMFNNDRHRYKFHLRLFLVHSE
jgi:hypothetical protein